MAMPTPWYNAERVAQPGSVILRNWMAQREAARSVVQTSARTPVRGSARMRRSYSGAAVDNLTASFSGDLGSINRDLAVQLSLLVGRSRQLAKNDPYVRKFLRMAQNHIVGPAGFGLSVPCKQPDGKIDTFDKWVVETGFTRWSKRGVCDVTGRMSFRRLCRLLVLCWARDGEFIVRRVRDKSLNAFGYALQVIDPILLDYTYRADFPDGRKIRLGVELNVWGRPIAYHFVTDVEMAPYSGGRRVRVPAEEIWHGFLQDEPDQVRGVPWVHASMRRLNDLGGYVEAAVIAARVGASKMGFYIPPAAEVKGQSALEEGLVEDDDSDDLVAESTPGTYEKLPAGYDFKTFDPDYPHQNFDAFLKAALRGVSAGLPGSDYNTLANDLEGVNYSSMRSGSLESRDDWKGLQGEFVDMFLEPLSPEWLSMGFVSGQLDPLPVSKFSKYDCFAWQGRRWTWVDPKNDVETRILEIDKGLNSYSSTIREQGGDPEVIWTELEHDLDRMAVLAEKRRALNPVQPPAAPAHPAGAAVSGGQKA
jgi:lambda family phage portal protein